MLHAFHDEFGPGRCRVQRTSNAQNINASTADNTIIGSCRTGETITTKRGKLDRISVETRGAETKRHPSKSDVRNGNRKNKFREKSVQEMIIFVVNVITPQLIKY